FPQCPPSLYSAAARSNRIIQNCRPALQDAPYAQKLAGKMPASDGLGLLIFADAQRQGVLGLDDPVQQTTQQVLLDLGIVGIVPEVRDLVGIAVAVIQFAEGLARVIGELVVASGDGLDVETPVVAGELGQGVLTARAAVTPQDR